MSDHHEHAPPAIGLLGQRLLMQALNDSSDPAFACAQFEREHGAFANGLNSSSLLPLHLLVSTTSSSANLHGLSTLVLKGAAARLVQSIDAQVFNSSSPSSSQDTAFLMFLQQVTVTASARNSPRELRDVALSLCAAMCRRDEANPNVDPPFTTRPSLKVSPWLKYAQLVLEASRREGDAPDSVPLSLRRALWATVDRANFINSELLPPVIAFMRETVSLPAMTPSPADALLDSASRRAAFSLSSVDPRVFDMLKKDIATASLLPQVSVFPPEIAKIRRNRSKPLKQIVDLIGNSVALFETALYLIRLLFAETGDGSLCLLRADLIMAFHDISNTTLTSSDAAHQLAWVLDAIPGSAVIEPRRIEDIKSAFASVNSTDRLLGDMGMLTLSPFALNAICRSLYFRLSTVVENQALPRSDPSIAYLVYLLRFGQNSQSAIAEDCFAFVETSSCDSLLDIFLPQVAMMLIDDQERDSDFHRHKLEYEALGAKAVHEPEAQVQFDLATIPARAPREPVSAQLIQLVSSDLLAAKLLLFYVVVRTVLNDEQAVCDLLDALGNLPQASQVFESEIALVDALVSATLALDLESSVRFYVLNALLPRAASSEALFVQVSRILLDHRLASSPVVSSPDFKSDFSQYLGIVESELPQEWSAALLSRVRGLVGHVLFSELMFS